MPPKNKESSNLRLVLCHHLKERSFHFRGKQFPICARCTGILVGYFTLPLFHFNLISPSLSVIIVLTIPLLIDSLTQALHYRESNNKLRFITGFLAGAAQAALIVWLGQNILWWINRGG